VGHAATQSRPFVSNAICTGLTSSGNIDSSAKSTTFIPACTVIAAIADSPERNSWAPPGSDPGLFVATGISSGSPASSTGGRAAPGSSSVAAVAQMRRSRLPVFTSRYSSSRCATS
jgi:hypothetical protein